MRDEKVEIEVFEVPLRFKLARKKIDKTELKYMLGMVRGLVHSISGQHPVTGLTNESFYIERKFRIQFPTQEKAEIFVEKAHELLSKHVLDTLSISPDPNKILRSTALVTPRRKKSDG